MPFKSHVEKYETVESIRDRRCQTGFRLRKEIYYKVIEEDIATDYRLTLRTRMSNSFAAEQYSQGWNEALEASNERQDIEDIRLEA